MRVCLITLVCIVGLADLTRPAYAADVEHDLLHRSKKISVFAPAVQRDWMWSSDTTAVCTEVDAGQSALQLVQYSVASAKRKVLTAFNTRYRNWLVGHKATPASPAVYASFRISPNGETLLIYPAAYTSIGNQNCPVVAAPVDGSTGPIWYSTGKFPYNLTWLADSRYWFEPVLNEGAEGHCPSSLVIRDTEKPAFTKVLPEDGKSMSADYISGVIKHRIVSINVGEGGTDMRVAHVTVQSTLNPASVTRKTIRLPFAAASAAICPTNGRIAWLVYYHGDPPAQTPASRKRKKLVTVKPEVQKPSASKTSLAIWVTDLEGLHPSEVGHVAASHASDIEHLTWLPGGRQLSFVYQGGLYVVGVLAR